MTGLTRLARIINVIVSPLEVFKDLKNNSDWLILLSLIIIVATISTFTLLPTVIIPSRIEQVTVNQQLSIEQKNQFIASLQGVTPYISSLLSTLILIIISFLIISSIISMVRFFFGGEKVEFKYIFTAVCYAGIVSSIATIFNSIFIYTQQTLTTGLSLSLFLNNLQGFTARFFSSIELFGIWETILFSLILVSFYNYSKVKSFSIMFSLYFIWKIIIALLPLPGLT